MALEIITTNQTSLYTIHSTDQVFLTQGVIASSTGDVFQGTNDGEMLLSIHGSIFSVGNAIDLGSTVIDFSSLSVFIGEPGSVQSVGTTNSVIYIRRNGADIVNYGEITGVNAAVHFGFHVTSGTLTNTGVITSTSAIGILADGNPDLATGLFEIQNTGQVFGETNGIFIDDQDLALYNSGMISGGIGVRVRENSAGTNVMDINNTGTIIGTGGTAVFGALGDDTVTNSGLITGGVILDAGNDTYVGRGGVIEGDLLGGAGADILDIRGGEVTGDVQGGADNDIYYVSDSTVSLLELAAEGTDTVNAESSFKLGANFENLILSGDGNIRGIGNTEDNVITGNIGDNRLRGKAGEDTLNGEDGDDRLFGNADNDRLNGGDGDDLLKGGKARDKLYGDEGDDRLFGGGYKDKLYGGDGEDRLVGGSGKDELTGGADADTFVFRRISDSENTADFDTILDFQVNEDIIDLSKLPGDMTYIGSSAFSNTAGEVRVTTPGSDSVIKIDIDGDGSADMKIFVTGTTALDALDFLL